jgi:hypothetical protein
MDFACSTRGTEDEYLKEKNQEVEVKIIKTEYKDIIWDVNLIHDRLLQPR